jgi:hypothetical protein
MAKKTTVKWPTKGKTQRGTVHPPLKQAGRRLPKPFPKTVPTTRRVPGPTAE